MEPYGGLTAGQVREYLPSANRALTNTEIENYLVEATLWAQAVVGSLPPDQPFLKGAIRDLAISQCLLNLAGARPEANEVANTRREDALRRLKAFADSAVLPGDDNENEGIGAVQYSGASYNTLPELWDMDEPLIPRRYDGQRLY